MSEPVQQIICPNECVVTVVHELSVLPSLTADQGWLIAKAILLCWCVAWGFRQLMRLSTDRKQSQDDED